MLQSLRSPLALIVGGVAIGLLPGNRLFPQSGTSPAVSSPRTTAVAFAGGNPKFSAFVSMDQSIPLQIATSIQFDAEHFDVGGGFDPVSHRYVAPLGGKYQFNFTATADAYSTQVLFTMSRNGVPYAVLNGMTGLASYALQASSGAILVELGAGDYVEIQAISSTASCTILGALGGAARCTFSGFLVGT